VTEPPVSGKLEEAARWFAARHRGVMTLEERARYQAWAGDAANSLAMARLERVWSELELAQESLPDAIRQSVPAPPLSRLARSALLAAMCAVSLGIGVLSYSDNTGFWTTLNWTDR